MAIKILLADDHVLIRQAVRVLLEGAGFEVVGEAADGHEAIRLARELKPDVALLDLVMPLLNGLDAAREIHQASPRTRTILLTMCNDDDQILQAMRIGVRGCVLKSYKAEDLFRAIQHVAGGGFYLSPDLSGTVVEAYRSGSETPADPLSQRERQVLQLIAEGKRTREIAEVLGISIKTAESHRSRIMKRLGISQTAGLVRYAIHRGLSPL